MLQTLYCSQNNSFIRTPLRLRRWTTCSTVLHRYLYSPIEKEIYQQEHSTITQWFASPPNRKLLSLIPSINHKDYKNLFTNMIDSYQLASSIPTPILETNQWDVQENDIYFSSLYRTSRNGNSTSRMN